MSDEDGTKTGETDPNAGAGGTEETGTKTDEAPKAFDINSLPEEARAYLTKRIADAQAKARLMGKANAAKDARAEVLAEFAKTLGLTTDEPTSDQLNAALADTARERDAVTRERDAIKAIVKLGGDADAMTDSNAFLAKLGKLDVKSDTYAADLAALVGTEIEANPRFKADGKPAASTGGGGEFGKRTPDTSADDGTVESMDKRLYGGRK